MEGLHSYQLGSDSEVVQGRNVLPACVVDGVVRLDTSALNIGIGIATYQLQDRP